MFFVSKYRFPKVMYVVFVAKYSFPKVMYVFWSQSIVFLRFCMLFGHCCCTYN